MKESPQVTLCSVIICGEAYDKISKEKRRKKNQLSGQYGQYSALVSM